MKLSKKSVIAFLIIINLIFSMGMSFSFWASSVNGDSAISATQVTVGSWDYVNEATELEVATFRSDHATVLALTIETVEVSNKAAVEAALSAYGLLSVDAKTQLLPEKELLISLLAEIIALENSIYLNFEGYTQDTQVNTVIDINGRSWYGSGAYIAGSASYDVWNDTRSLALISGSYFESRDLFINGIDKITLYHGALNYNKGVSIAFKVEYKLDSNPTVWSTVQKNGSNLIINAISGTPLTYVIIDLDITEAVNIRFTPVIGNTTYYINLDDIRIYEHVVPSTLEAETFRTVYAATLALTVETVEISDKGSVEAALAAYDLLSVDAKAELSVEKALLDSLSLEIENQEDIVTATAAVIIAEGTYSQTDLDLAQVLVTACVDGLDKTALQNRINFVQSIIDSVSLFESNHADALGLTINTVDISDQAIVEAALAAYNSLSVEAKALLTAEKALLNSLLAEINNQLPIATQVAEFRANHAYALALTVETVQISDKGLVELALEAYDLLSNDAKALLTAEKALLDSLLVEIESQQILEATAAVVIAETSYLQADLDLAQALVTACTNGLDKTALQDRLNILQDTINAAIAFRIDHASVLALTIETVEVSDKAAIEDALSAYGLLNNDVKGLLADEKDLLISLLTEIIAFEHSVFLNFEGYTQDTLINTVIDINGRSWYGSGAYIAGNPSFDVWNDTRSLALNNGTYFESRDLFINGIDKITLYHGALNYNKGVSIAFKVEYSLDSNPTVWSTVQKNGSDLIINTVSVTPLTYVVIDLDITEAVNIRFTPVIGNTSYYINLDDIRIYEHVVSSTLEAETFRTVYQAALALTVETVELNDKDSVEAALAAYNLLSVDAKAELSVEKALLSSLLAEINSQLPTATQVANFRTTHFDALALTVETVEIIDKAIVELALETYDLLSFDAKALLTVEKALLDSLLVEIENQENIIAATAAVVVAEGSNLQADLDTAQILVTACPNEAVKTNLQNRLNVVQDIIDVEQAKTIILNYFTSSNPIVVANLSNTPTNNTIKENAFIAKANEIVSGLDVVISVKSTQRINNKNTTYTINITKNGAVLSVVVPVTFTR